MNAHPTTDISTPTAVPSGGQPLASDHSTVDTHTSYVAGELLDPDHHATDAQVATVGVERSADGHFPSDNHRHAAVGEPSTGTDQAKSDTHAARVCSGTSSSQPPTSGDTTPIMRPSDGWLELRIWAEMFHDSQQARIAAVNRAERGGVEPIIYEAYTDSLKRAEHECLLAMRRCYRRVVPEPIQSWQKAMTGIGIDRLAKILGHLGHPVWATPHHWEGTGSNRVLITDPPFERSIGQLWQYCGHGAPARKRKGMSADDLAAMGSPVLKSLLWNAATECMKCRNSPFRLVYEEARQNVADKVHTVECVRCGPSGKPAQPGDPWSAGHQHAHALRIVGKEILRDLWLVANRDAAA